MSLWRAAALERLPQLRDVIIAAPNVMSLWIELRLAFERAYREPRNEDLIGRIYSYADWCVCAPRNDEASRDPVTAVAVAFYEHIPELPAACDDMPRWFRVEEVADSKSVFAYHLGDEAFAKLLEHMKRNRHRYVARQS